MPVKAIPDGYHSVTPYLVCDGAERVIEFLQKAFGATDLVECMRHEGKIMHAEIKVGDSIIMLSDSNPQYKSTPTMLYLYVEDVDAVYKKALQAGGTSISEPTDMFWGDRKGGVTDPSGNQWWIATHKEDVSPAEMEKRAKAFAENCGKEKAHA